MQQQIQQIHEDFQQTVKMRLTEEVQAGFQPTPVQLPEPGCAFCGSQDEARDYKFGMLIERSETRKRAFFSMVVCCAPCAEAGASEDQVRAKMRDMGEAAYAPVIEVVAS